MKGAVKAVARQFLGTCRSLVTVSKPSEVGELTAEAGRIILIHMPETTMDVCGSLLRHCNVSTSHECHQNMLLQ